MKPASFFLKIPVIFFVSVLLISCSTAGQQADKELLESINTILILPAQAAPEKKEADNAELETGIMSLNSALITYFENKKYAKLVTTDKELFQDMPGGNRLSMIQNIGRKFDCDAVLTCNINRYVERKGKKYAIESPASVAFECKLIEVKTGRAACFLNFDETQQALTDNLLAASLRLKWLTAEELLNDGLIKKLSTCPYVTR
jgi:hypothetical protein